MAPAPTTLTAQAVPSQKKSPMPGCRPGPDPAGWTPSEACGSGGLGTGAKSCRVRGCERELLQTGIQSSRGGGRADSVDAGAEGDPVLDGGGS